MEMHRVDVEKKPSLEDRVAALEAKVGALQKWRLLLHDALKLLIPSKDAA